MEDRYIIMNWGGGGLDYGDIELIFRKLYL